MLQLSDIAREKQMAQMADFDEEMPSVGIFWYDPADKVLFGVKKMELTPKMVEEAADKGLPFINYPHLYKDDYTQIPRGRVAWSVDKFIVLVGHWAEPILEELSELIEAEFHLPCYEFVYDEHWDLAANTK